jgi:hypothetical protein
MMTTTTPSKHQPSHLDLLSRVPTYGAGVSTPRAPLSAVVVPTSRRPDEGSSGLGLAARIAEAKGAQLIVIRSGEASRYPLPAGLLPRSAQPTLLLDLPAGSHRPLPAWHNDKHVVATFHRRNDLGLKRNLALLLGQRMGWSNILMLDDDISTTPASELPLPRNGGDADPFLRIDDVLAEFHEYPQVCAAGYLAKNFDDNSVVCHIRRLVGLVQETFVSGSALVVRCGEHLPFFPATYNEDWLFFFGLILQGRHVLPSSTVRLVGTVHQKAYYPYSVKRAQSEELGDILAEGLLSLIGMPAADVLSTSLSKDYWSDAVWARQSMIIDLLAAHRQRYGDSRHQLLMDVDAALRASLSIYTGSIKKWGALLAQYVQLLLVDLEMWHECLAQNRTANPADENSLPIAVADLGLADCATWLTRPCRPVLQRQGSAA